MKKRTLTAVVFFCQGELPRHKASLKMTNLQLSHVILPKSVGTCRTLHCAAEMTFLPKCLCKGAPEGQSCVLELSPGGRFGRAPRLISCSGEPQTRDPTAESLGPKHITKPTRVLPCDLTGGDKEITSRNILPDLSYAGAVTDSHQAAL